MGCLFFLTHGKDMLHKRIPTAPHPVRNAPETQHQSHYELKFHFSLSFCVECPRGSIFASFLATTEVIFFKPQSKKRDLIFLCALVSLWFNILSFLPHSPFEGYFHQAVGLYCELHWQHIKHIFTEAVDDHVNGILFGESALLAVEELIFADF